MAASKYDTHVKPRFIEIEAWCRNGVSDKGIAKNLGLSYSTFRIYIQRFKALSALLKKTKEVVDIQVENALLKRALGYEYEETYNEYIYDKEGNEKLIKSKRTIKQVVPDVGAQAFWLKNRKSADWRDRKDDIESDIPLPLIDYRKEAKD